MRGRVPILSLAVTDLGCPSGPRGTSAPRCRVMRRLASILAAALTTHACASSPAAGPPPSCSPTEAGAKFALGTFGVMDKMADECATGTDIRACNPANYVLGPIVIAMVAPLLFAVGTMDDGVQRHQCPPGATPAKEYEGTSADVSVELERGR